MKAWFLVVLLGMAPANLPAASITAQVGADSLNKQLLVDAFWLQKRLEDQDIIVIDVRSPEKYRQGHIRNAVNIPTQSTFKRERPASRMASIQTIQNLFGDAGIDGETNVVIYDNGEFIHVGRVFWVLEVHGHHRVAILNGGFPAWIKNGYKTSQNVTSHHPKKFIAEIQPDKLATRLHTRLAINDKNKILIDARSTEEYQGKLSKSYKFAHIPGAVSVPWDKNIIQLDGIFMSKSLSELEDVYKDYSKDKKVITYCNKGRESSFTYFILRRLGYKVSHYDGSWSEWGNLVNFPVEK